MKRLYWWRFLEQVMVVIDEEDRDVGQLTLDNLRKYDLKSGIFNLARSWKDVSASTLSNGWNRLIRGTDPVIEFEGFETDHFHRHIVQAGETVTEDVSDWLDGDEGDPGYQTLTDAEIADSVLHPDQQNSSDDDDDDDVLPTRPTASAIRQAAETLVEYLEHPNTEADLRVFATSLREIRDRIFATQSRWILRQTTIDTFFKPAPSGPSSSLSSKTPPSSPLLMAA
ncbi:Tigger transposable element-derived protein 7 [Chionoecetes opilio]|uniref:Tigger transposable element-derived protein 7 n=1 Tax=Chionoecetes opilio TaxID=41210 RepID=A0A8J4XVA6_CHIOP|nr:Tigger transposable element-derived protein 7 [Chionoecetes opilio]